MADFPSAAAARSAAEAISACLEAQPLGDRPRRILDAGRGPARRRTVTPLLIEGSWRELVFLEGNRSRLEAASRELPPGARLIEAEIDQIGLNERFDLIYFDLAPRAITGFLTKTAYNVVSLAAAGAYVIVNVPVAAEDGADAADREAFDRFLTTETGCDRQNAEEVGELFSGCLPFPLAAVADAANSPVRGFVYRTLLFRNTNARHETFRCTLKTAGHSNFRLDDVAAALENLRRRYTFMPTGPYVEGLLRPEGTRRSKPPHHLRHDIHHDLQTALRMARVEHAMSLPAAFFVMHPHALSKRYIELQETTEVLLEIQSLGHEIGVHVDVLDLTVKGSGVVAGLREFVGRLRAAGLRLEIANTHGNTGYALAGSRHQNVFSEYPSPSDGGVEAAPAVVRGFGSQSLAAIARELGIATWFDSHLYSRGALSPASKFQVTDNYKTLSVWRAGPQPTETAEKMFETPPWQVPSGFAWDLADVVEDETCTYLLHPQLYK